MKNLFTAFILLANISILFSQSKEQREGNKTDPANNPIYNYYNWPNQAPEKCPFEMSKDIKRIAFTGRYANYAGADTWYLQWAEDGNCYSTWTDGNIDAFHCNSCIRALATGQAKIVGNDPLNLKVVNLGRIYSGQNYYPCVSLIANNVFYIGTYEAFTQIGYFNGFRYSTNWDHFTDKTEQEWKDSYWVKATDSKDSNFFDESGKAKFRVMHSVIFGQNNKLSPDGKVYITAHGFSTGNGKNDWDKGDAIYLCRTDAEIKSVIDSKSYEFFAGYNKAKAPVWTKNIKDCKPILDWPNHLGSESITYIKQLNKYILLTCRLKENEENLPYNLMMIWESDNITGPFGLVHSLRDWGPQTYFPTIPAKFISEDGKRMWLVVASNYASNEFKPFGCRYAASFHEIILDFDGKSKLEAPVLGKNIAPLAKITATSFEPNFPPEKAIDGIITKDTLSNESSWASQEGEGAYLQLKWNEPKTINKIRLYDRPSEKFWIQEGYITFSDGSVEWINAVPSNKAATPAEINFDPKTISWIKFTITKGIGEITKTTFTEPGKALGLTEIEVYESVR
jgi:hypothetical protein